MRVLFDENMNRHLSRALPGHEVVTVQSLGWTGTKNGKLLNLAIRAGFEVLVTMDDNLKYQQNLSAFEIAVIVLRSRRNRQEYLMPLMSKVLQALPTAPKGQRTVIES